MMLQNKAKMKIIQDIGEIFRTETIWVETVKGQDAYLRISEKLNIVKINFHWGPDEHPETTYILIINNNYILNSNKDVSSSMDLWSTLLKKTGTNEYEYNETMINALNNQCYAYDNSNSQLIYAFKHAKYIGDFFFHFGHFFLDALPTIKCMETLCKKRVNKLYQKREFHEELLQANSLTNTIEMDRQSTQQNYVTKIPDIFYTWIEVFESQQLIDVDYNFGLFYHINKTHGDNLGFKILTKESQNEQLKGLHLARGKSYRQRFKNTEDILGVRSTTLSHNGEEVTINTLIESADPEELGVYERVVISNKYDFVIGSPGSHMLPTLLYSDVVHFFVVPFLPTNKIIKQYLSGYEYLEDKIEWISDGFIESSDHVDQTVFDKLWFKEYEIDTGELFKNLLSTYLKINHT